MKGFGFKMGKNKVVISIVFGIIAMFLVVIMSIQFKTINQTDITSLESMQEEELRNQIVELKEKNERLESENQEFLYKYGNILKENETLKKLHIQDNNKLDFVMKHCILEQKIKDKIEELNKKEQKLQNSISAEEREEYSDANISWDLMNINIKREVLQDLIEGRK